MRLDEYARMYALEDTYWWFQGRQAIISALLKVYLPFKPRPGRVLDVGCGTGLTMERYAELKPIGLDFSTEALRFCRSRGTTRVLRGDVCRLPFPDNYFDLVFALDIMEHVERDDLMIQEIRRVLRPGGCLIATVPAHPDLWSDHDDALHHHRRYTPDTLLALLRLGGLKPRKFSYAITFTYFPIRVFRKLQNWWKRSAGLGDRRPRAHLIPLPRPINNLLIRLLGLEAWMLQRINLPVGVTLLTLAEKPRRRRRAQFDSAQGSG